MPKTTTTDVPRYFRWVGSKARLVPTLLPLFERCGPIKDTFVAPFLGSGAMELTLLAGPARGCARIVLADLNPHLIAAWRMALCPAPDFARLVSLLRWYEVSDARDTAGFYTDQAKFVVPTGDVERAARFLYLNQTSFHGLWRENKSRVFNAPREDTRRPFAAQVVIDKAMALRTFLSPFKNRITFLSQDFGLTLDRADLARAVVFADPPYVPLNPTRSFSGYTAAGFNAKAQKDLAELVGLCKFAVVSNSDTPKTRQIYAEAKDVIPIQITHMAGPQKKSRTPVGEVALIFERTGT